MIRINLLPHREEKRKARRQQFYVLAGLVAALAAVIALLGWTLLSQMIGVQEDKNQFIRTKNADLDKEIAQVKALESEIGALQAKKKVVEDLQAKRSLAVDLLNEMAKRTPEGTYLKSLKQDAQGITISGYAQSNSRVSEFMLQLGQSTLFEQPKLVETKSAVIDRRRMQEFSLVIPFRKKQEVKPAEGKKTEPKK